MYTTLIAITTGASAALIAFIAGILASLHISINAMRAWDGLTGRREPDDDEELRLGALAIRDVLRAAARISNNPDGWQALPREDCRALGRALIAAEDRFHDLLEELEDAGELDEAVR